MINVSTQMYHTGILCLANEQSRSATPLQILMTEQEDVQIEPCFAVWLKCACHADAAVSMPATKKQKTVESNRLEDHIGLALDGAPPRSAVRQFFDRYTGLRSSKDDFYFSHKHMEEGVVATLIAPALGDRHFEGQQCSNEKSAEQSAAAVFVQDPEVLQIARCLPPPLATLRKIADKYHSKKQQLAAEGLSTKEAAEEILRDIYDNLRDKGCRTALWDGYISWEVSESDLS